MNKLKTVPGEDEVDGLKRIMTATLGKVEDAGSQDWTIEDTIGIVNTVVEFNPKKFKQIYVNFDNIQGENLEKTTF